jgi:hypothetical protein
MAIIACTRCIFEAKCMGDLAYEPNTKCIIGSLDLSREEKLELLRQWGIKELNEEVQKRCEEERARRDLVEIKTRLSRGGA